MRRQARALTPFLVLLRAADRDPQVALGLLEAYSELSAWERVGLIRAVEQDAASLPQEGRGIRRLLASIGTSSGASVSHLTATKEGYVREEAAAFIAERTVAGSITLAGVHALQDAASELRCVYRRFTSDEQAQEFLRSEGIGSAHRAPYASARERIAKTLWQQKRSAGSISPDAKVLACVL